MGARKTISVGLACGLIQLPSDTYWNLLMLKNQRNFSSSISSILPPEGNLSRRDAQRKSDGRLCLGKSSQCPLVPRNFCVETNMLMSVIAVDQFSPVSSVPTHVKKLLHRNQHGSEGDGCGPVLPTGAGYQGGRKNQGTLATVTSLSQSQGMLPLISSHGSFTQRPSPHYSSHAPNFSLCLMFHGDACGVVRLCPSTAPSKSNPRDWRDGSMDKVPAVQV